MESTSTFPVTTLDRLWDEYHRTRPPGRSVNKNDALVGTIANDVLQLRGEDLVDVTADELQELIVRDRQLAEPDADDGGTDVR